MRPQAGGTLIVILEKATPRLRQAEEPKRMPGWCGVEDDVIVGPVVAGQAAGKFIERSDLCRAGARQLFPNRVPILVACARPHLAPAPLCDRIGGGGGINIKDMQPLGTGDCDR